MVRSRSPAWHVQVQHGGLVVVLHRMASFPHTPLHGSASLPFPPIGASRSSGRGFVHGDCACVHSCLDACTSARVLSSLVFKDASFVAISSITFSFVWTLSPRLLSPLRWQLRLLLSSSSLAVGPFDVRLRASTGTRIRRVPSSCAFLLGSSRRPLVPPSPRSRLRPACPPIRFLLAADGCRATAAGRVRPSHPPSTDSETHARREGSRRSSDWPRPPPWQPPGDASEAARALPAPPGTEAPSPRRRARGPERRERRNSSRRGTDAVRARARRTTSACEGASWRMEGTSTSYEAAATARSSLFRGSQGGEHVQIAVERGPEFDEDREIEGLRTQVARLTGLAKDIGVESKTNHQMLETLEQSVVRAQAAMRSTMHRLHRAYERGGSNHLLYLVLFAFGFFVLLWFLTKLR
mmetsp:Transcript_7895/g.48805  ORF Transcript_7895/g.48805 Transcript_7895/m.48805 type:complete len:410 (+) Transcript_7895:564-1793(+)